ncbi:MAG: response regulator [Deltaproteobacteria bacterium]|nr:response regulator [Deltaproteobacteria bacterium]
MSAKILFVDDDAHLLAAMQRQLRRFFEVDAALGPHQGLEAVSSGGPYAVIVSDLRMPGMDGIRFFARVKELSPDSVRIMLTGNADLTAAIEAVNEGHIFRFLTKPCPPEVLTKALEMGLNQHRLVLAERELLEKTLSGGIQVLTQILSLINPEAFGRASRITRYVREVAFVVKAPHLWQLETAAMLSQIGFILLPPEVLTKIYRCRPLSAEENQLLQMHPFVAADLLKRIPRLEEVSEIIAYQEKRFDGSGIPQDARKGPDIPLGSRLLKVVLDFDILETAGLSRTQAVQKLKQRPGWYDPALLTALEAVLWIESRYDLKRVTLRELTDSMILDDDVFTKDNTMLIAKGQEVNPLIRKRLHTFAETVGIKEPLRVLVPITGRQRAAAQESAGRLGVQEKNEPGAAADPSAGK